MDLSVRQPTNFERGGYYPTQYGFVVNDNVYDIYLGGLAATAASPVPEPSTYGVLAALFLTVGALWRRRRTTRPSQG